MAITSDAAGNEISTGSMVNGLASQDIRTIDNKYTNEFGAIKWQ